VSGDTTTARDAVSEVRWGTGAARLRVVIVSQQRADAPPLRARGRERFAGRVERDIGGVQAHFTAVREALRRDGHDVRHASTFDSPWGLQIAAATGTKLLERFDRSAAARWHRWWHRTLLDRSVRRVSNDLAHSSEPVVYYAQCPQSAKAAMRHRIPGSRVILVVHYSERSEAEELFLRGVCERESALYRGVIDFEREVLPAVDGLVFVSERSADMVLDLVPEAAAVPRQVVPNFLDVRYADGQHHLDQDRDLVSVGTLEPRKNHTYLLDIVAAARDEGRPLTLTIVGAGNERTRLEEKVEALRLGDLVTLAGGTRDVRPFLRRHRLYVHVSTAESFGIVLIEAMSFGRPVAAVPVGGIPDVFDDDVEGIHLSASDAAAAAKEIIGLLDDPERMDRLGANARRRFVEQFSDERVMPLLIDFFHRSLPRRDR
jgi:glycosyltransferase involved in cell wall biosynthesis